jgi:apolipoprotein N-acyltransferase
MTRTHALPGWAAALLTGVLFAVSRDVGPIGPLVLIAPIPLLVFALNSDRAMHVALCAFLARAIGMIGLVAAYGSSFPAAILVIAIVVYGLEYALVVVLTRMLARRLHAALAVLSYPVLLTAFECLLQAGSPHGSFGALGYSLIDILPVAQLASIAGGAALSFWAALLPMGISLVVAHPKSWRTAMVTAGVPWVLAIVFGAWRLSTPYESTVHIGLGAIDSLTGQSIKDGPHAEAVAQSYATLVGEIARSETSRPLTVILPEKVFTHRDAWGTKSFDVLQKAADDAAVTIVAGFDEEVRAGRYANTARVFSPHSRSLRYAKRKLIPGLESEFIVGDESLVNAGRGVAICKDMDFPSLLREYGNRTPLMLVPAWDFVRDGRLHSRMAVLRGIENGFAVARAAAMGRLTVSDAFGRIIAERETDPRSATSMTATLGLVELHTVYTRIGDVFAWLTVVAAALLIGAVALHERSRGNERSARTEAASQPTL